jgi:hypothetical protein
MAKDEVDEELKLASEQEEFHNRRRQEIEMLRVACSVCAMKIQKF